MHKISSLQQPLRATEKYESSLLKLQPQQPVSLNLFGLQASIFTILEQKFQNFLEESQNSPTAEFGLPTTLTAPDVLSEAATMKMLSTQDRWLGITYKDDLPFVENSLNQLIVEGIYI